MCPQRHQVERGRSTSVPIEGVFPLARLLDADEVFICASVREVMPVAEIDGKRFRLGPAAHDLQQALRRRATT